MADQAVPDAFAEGIRLFNEGEYFDCHETLELLWMAEKGAVRELYQGIIQLAVALYHLKRGNEKGAGAVLSRAIEHLRPFLPAHLGIDVEALLADAQRLQAGTAWSQEHERSSVQIRAATS